MIETIYLPGDITLHLYSDDRFKQGCLSIQFLMPLEKKESALNALIPAILLRGSKQYPDILSITAGLDELYGSGIGALARKYRNCYGTGFYLNFLDDRFALQGDQVLFPLLDMASDLLFHPVGNGNEFRPDIVETEKQNLISAIESRKNNKASYAMHRLIDVMCANDPSGTSRLGTVEDVSDITCESAFAHYQKMLHSAPISVFYVGSIDSSVLTQKLSDFFACLNREPSSLPGFTPFHAAEPRDFSEQQKLTQSHLCMGFLTEITIDHPLYPAMQLLNILYGSGMTSKLFMNVREKRSLCYSISSVYTGGTGILTVYAGIDAATRQETQQEILNQLDACCNGDISDAEITAAKETFYSTLAAVLDTPSAIENYFTAAIQNHICLNAEVRMDQIRNVTREELIAAAKSIRLHSTFFLEGDNA